MDWFPAIITTSFFSIILWFSRNYIAVKLTSTVKHEYDKKIEELKTTLRNNEESFKFDLRQKESQIDVLRNGALSAISNRQSIMFQRKLQAIEDIWQCIIDLGPEKSVAGRMSVIKFEAAAKEASKNLKAREAFAMFGNIENDESLWRKSLKSRPFVSEITWAYFIAYHAIVSFSVLKLNFLKSGLDDINILDDRKLKELIITTLPHQKNYINKFGSDALYFLLDEIEMYILNSFKSTLNGEESDRETLLKAADIIKQAQSLVENNENYSA